MEKITIIGLDLAKSVFQVHAITEEGHVAVRRTLRRHLSALPWST
jgi:transposase